MPWCPQCKNEYQDGYTQCNDCKCDLVESFEEEVEYEYEPFFQSESQKTAEKLANFFEYSDLPAKVTFDEEYEIYVVSIPPDMEKHARKLYQAFHEVESERMINAMMNQMASQKEKQEAAESDETEAEEDYGVNSEEYSEEEDDNVEEASEDTPDYHSHDKGVYVMKADQYKDLIGTVWVFLLFGIAGIVFVILNIVDVISFLNGWLPNLVLGALFLAFFFVAITTNQRAKKVRSEIDAENKMTEKINLWLKEHATKEFMDSIYNDNISEEANYIRSTEIMKEQLLKEFGKQNLSYLDRLVEEYFTNVLDEEIE